MKFHIDAKHPEQGEKQFFCDLCGKGFIYEETHKQHSRFQANIFWLFEFDFRPLYAGLNFDINSSSSVKFGHITQNVIPLIN